MDVMFDAEWKNKNTQPSETHKDRKGDEEWCMFCGDLTFVHETILYMAKKTKTTVYVQGG